MRDVVPLPTSPRQLATLSSSLGAEQLIVKLPPPGQTRYPDVPTTRVIAQLLQGSASLRAIRFTGHSSAEGPDPQESPRSLARAGFWSTLAAKGIDVLPDPTTTSAADALCWDPASLPVDHQPSLFGSELQWRKTRAGDVSTRLEHRVGLLDRPDSRLASFDTADDLAGRIAFEILELTAGGVRGSETHEAIQFSRLLARAVATLIENVRDHAFDFDCLSSDERSIAELRAPLSALLISLTRGGGSRASSARESSNRVHVVIHDNGISIPTSVRQHGRLDGRTDSEEVVLALLENSLTNSGRGRLRGLGYPELLELAESSTERGWTVSLQVATQYADTPQDLIIGNREIGRKGSGDVASASVLRGVPFVGTSVVLTIKIPGRPDWLAEV